MKKNIKFRVTAFHSKCILFKTNYRSIEEAEKNIKVLDKNLNSFKFS